MGRTALTIIFILAFSFLGTINLITANPFPTNPEISILSPVNKTYDVKSLVLDIEIETQFDGYYFTSTRRVSYSIDGNTAVSATETNYSYSSENKTSKTKYTAILPDLTEGLHYLTVYAEYDYDVKIISSQTGVHFTIETNSEPTSEIPEFPSWILLPLLLVATLVVTVARDKLLRKRLE
jgi:hypothetical protein